MRLLRVLTIGGSDSSADAGIQADLKTFTALGVSPAVAITAVTAQNAFGVEAIYEVPASVVEAQLRAVLAEGEVAFAKTGMLFSAEIVKVVADFFTSHSIKFVLDPVLRAGSGVSLLKQDAFEALIERLLPLSAVVTPNVSEAEAISGVKIETVEDAREAAVRIAEKGARAVVVKGGHLEAEVKAGRSTDILYDAEREAFEVFSGAWLPLRVERAHGAGCTFSAALAVALVKGLSLKEAVAFAKSFVTDALRFGVLCERAGGESVLVANPAGRTRKRAERFEVLENLKEAVRRLSALSEFRKLIPEVGVNLAMATESGESVKDVAAIDGRITCTKSGFRIGSVEFGASSHVARAILAMRKFNKWMRSAINIKYSPEIVEVCEQLFEVASFDRGKEPSDAKEGKTMDWGIREAVQRALRERGRIPDVIYDCGAVGKEPVVRIFGVDAVDVVEKVRRILEKLK